MLTPGARLISHPIPKRLNGTGLVWLGCKQGTAAYFSLDTIPAPDEWGTTAGNGYRRVRGSHLYRSRFKGKSYRIAYSALTGGGRQAMASFRLSTGHTLQTLALIANHLDQVEADWLYFTNADGARLRGISFQTKLQPT